MSVVAGSAQRVQLSDFLKACRGRLSPSAMGLPVGARRRTAGLRREDVAALAGVSSTWYTWLEQGRDVRVSDNVLESLSRTLRLTDEERDHLFSLAQHRPAAIQPQHAVDLSASVRRTLDALNLPALVMTLRWDVIYWNRAMALAIRDYARIAPEERNLLKILLMNPDWRTDAEDYDAMARRILAKLRVDYGLAGADPAFDALIEELNEICPAFRRYWRAGEISGRSEGVHVERHPTEGEITFGHSSYVVEGAPALRTVIYAPYDAASAEKLSRIVGTASAAKVG
jgi:transcriptional regulator with XRE-family HTH domain